MSRPAPAAEVIQDWADSGEAGGWTFERSRMEKAVRSICIDDPAVLPADVLSKLAQPPVPAGFKSKKEDVDLLTSKLFITKAQAEAALAKAQGDVSKAAVALVEG